MIKKEPLKKRCQKKCDLKSIVDTDDAYMFQCRTCTLIYSGVKKKRNVHEK